jgi:hypothetical protein
MASLPLSTMERARDALLMAIAIALFFLVLLAFAVTGHVADTRDSADWKPTDGGFRHP